MGEDKIQKFVEHMRAAGQSDDMIAQSLIDAGNNKLMVMNALNVSSIDELQPEKEESDVQTMAPIVDENGNLVFGQVPAAPQPPVSHEPLDRKSTSREYPKPAARIERPTKTPKSGIQPAKKTAPNTNQSTLEAQPVSKTDTEPKPATLSRTAALSASELHGHGVTPTPVDRPHAPAPTTSDKHASRPVVTKQVNDSPHSHHHKPHDYQETMEDLTDHKEIEAGSEHELGSGEIAPVKRLDSSPIEKTQDVKEEEQPEEVELPQEIEVNELESIDEQDTRELKQVAKDVDKEVEEINKPIKDPDANVPSSSEIKKVAETANALRSSLALRIVLISCIVLILVSLAVSVATKING